MLLGFDGHLTKGDYILGRCQMGKKKERRRFPQEFKVEAVRQSEREGVTSRQVAEELGISDRLLYKWRRELLKDPEPPASGDQASLQAEVQRLRRENERLQEERAILKKAIRYFAEEEE
jgi:transposase